MAQWGQGLDKDPQVGGMRVQKARGRVLHLAGVQMEQQVEHLGYSRGWNLASLEEVGRVLYCSQQRFWQGSFQVAHLPTGIQNKHVLLIVFRDKQCHT